MPAPTTAAKKANIFVGTATTNVGKLAIVAVGILAPLALKVCLALLTERVATACTYFRIVSACYEVESQPVDA